MVPSDGTPQGCVLSPFRCFIYQQVSKPVFGATHHTVCRWLCGCFSWPPTTLLLSDVVWTYPRQINFRKNSHSQSCCVWSLKTRLSRSYQQCRHHHINHCPVITILQQYLAHLDVSAALATPPLARQCRRYPSLYLPGPKWLLSNLKFNVLLQLHSVQSRDCRIVLPCFDTARCLSNQNILQRKLSGFCCWPFFRENVLLAFHRIGARFFLRSPARTIRSGERPRGIGAVCGEMSLRLSAVSTPCFHRVKVRSKRLKKPLVSAQTRVFKWLNVILNAIYVVYILYCLPLMFIGA